MKRLLLVTNLVAMLLQQAGIASAPQVLIKTKGGVGAREQDAEEAWGARVVEPPEKEDRLMGLLPALKLMATTQEKQQGTKDQAGTKDILRGLRSPRRGPEPDHDNLYHPPPEEAQEEAGPWSRVLLSRQVLRGPEEDRDHIYHPRGHS
ncbi:proline-rich acidic protein 1 [Diceros bicornis minor]|uniref:proline-rich acidic protein 1 n=1 Tax=Diceros bicornis minor TaxID=77932 RepID=UPI0026EFCCFE|nr:proline-rich acidic protein 1 [Diceros bicornis minor]